MRSRNPTLPKIGDDRRSPLARYSAPEGALREGIAQSPATPPAGARPLPPDVPSQKMRDEDFRKGRLVMDHANNGRFIQSRDDTFSYCRDRRDALRVSGQACLAKELSCSKHCNDCFLALL